MDYSTLVEKLLMACLRFLSKPRSWITTKDGPFKPEEGIPYGRNAPAAACTLA